MTPAEYVNSVIGTPWLKGSDDRANGGLDCWGVLVDKFKLLDGVTLPTPPWRQECDVEQAGAAALSTGDWEPCEPRDNACFCVFDKDGKMLHVGVILCGLAVHSDGTIDRESSCKAVDIKIMETRYEKVGYQVKYFTYVGAR